MRDKIDFTKEKPFFDNGDLKWYVSINIQRLIENEQANNLPVLKGFGCFVVKGKGVEDYVLIDHQQNIIAAFPYTNEGFGQMEARIKIMKVSKHFDDYENNI